MTDTLIILNPHAASGTARQQWQQVAILADQHLHHPRVVETAHSDAVFDQLVSASDAGISRVIAVGGDGTNNAMVNALARFQDQYPERTPLIYGTLPVGTGRDWARSTGIPFSLAEAIPWMAQAVPRPVDLGLLTITGGGDTGRHHFLNITSLGLGGEVDRRVNATAQRRPWTFLQATVMAMLTYQAQSMQVTLDGTDWFEGPSPLLVVANGSTFGHGMMIAPDAAYDDGLFEVLLVNTTSKRSLLTSLVKVYSGTHMNHPAVSYQRARHVRITNTGAPLGLDVDGEYLTGQHLEFTVRPGLIQMLG